MTEPSPPQNKKQMTDPRISGDPAILRAAVAQAHDRRLSREAALREKLKASAVPLPPELFEEVAKVSGLEIDEVMTDHDARDRSDLRFKIGDERGAMVFNRAP
ncbi:hypothetical protein [Mesorhizobium sp. M0306]|uniref:hypothetical protein n=1 Tax=unclassified Mesorhizobium TaxID=325217 RepID=UPI00333A932C